MVNKMTIILLLLCLLASCKKDTPVEAAPALPAATQSGKNTMGCKINGELFLLNGKRDSWGIGLRAVDKKLSDTTDFNISFNSRKPNIYLLMRSISLAAKEKDTLSLNGIYALDNSYVILQDFRENTVSGASYESNRIHGGTLIITKNTPSFMSGTFEFEAILDGEDSTKSVKVTEGRFDIEK